MRSMVKRLVPQGRTLVAWAAALAVALPASAVTVVTVSDQRVVSRWTLDSNVDLLIASSGRLLAQGSDTLLRFSGDVDHRGYMNVGWDADAPLSLQMSGLFIDGQRLPQRTTWRAGGRVDAHHIRLRDTDATFSDTVLNTGAVNDLATTNPKLVSNVVELGRFAALAMEGASLRINNTSQWNNFGSVVLRGDARVQVDGAFVQSRNPNTTVAGATLFRPSVVLVAYSPFGLTAPEWVVNGSADLGGGDLVNHGRVENNGTLFLRDAARIENRAPGPDPSTGFLTLGQFQNVGRLEIGNPGAVVGALPALSIFDNQRGATFLQLAGETVIGARSRFVNAGHADIAGGSVTVRSQAAAMGQSATAGEWLNLASGRLTVAQGVQFDAQGHFLNFGSVENRGTMVFSGQRWQTGDFATPQVGAFRIFEGGVARLQGAPGEPFSGGVDGLLELSASIGDPAGPARLELQIADLSVRGTGHMNLQNDAVVDLDAAGIFVEHGGRITLNSGRIDVRSGTFQTQAGSTVEAFSGLLGRRNLVVSAPSAALIGGAWTGDGAVVNEGQFRLGPGARMSLRSFEQRGGVLDIDQTAVLTTEPDPVFGSGGQLRMTGGRLKGSGVINGDVFIEGTAPPAGTDPSCGPTPTPGIACFTPGNSPGTLTIAGDLVLGAGVVVELEVGTDDTGALAWDQILARSIVAGPGTLVRVVVDAQAPLAPGVSFSMLSCIGACQLGAARFEVVGADASDFVIGAGGIFGYGIAPVPEPGTWAMLAAGLALLAVRRGRRPTPA